MIKKASHKFVPQAKKAPRAAKTTRDTDIILKFFRQRNQTAQTSQQCAKTVMNDIIYFCPAHLMGILKIFYARAETYQQQIRQCSPNPPGPLPGQQRSCQQARRIEQYHIHKVTAQDLRIAAIQHLPVGMKRHQTNCIHNSGSPVQDSLMQNHCHASGQTRKQKDLPPNAAAETLLQPQKDPGCHRHQDQNIPDG